MSVEPDLNQERRRRNTLVFWVVVLLLCLLGFLYWAFYVRTRAYTDDAYVEGNLVQITPLRSGFVTAIHTDDTFLVNEGQLLIELDKTDATIALEKAKQNLATKVREVSQAFHQVFVYHAELEIRKAELKKATQDYQHRADVLDIEGVSREDYEHAVAALQSSFFSFRMTETLYNKALSYVQGTTLRNHPVVCAARDDFRDAWVQLHRCNLYAPVGGLAAQRKIQVGMWTEAGEPLLSIIPLNQIWVNANFKETQLKRIRIGQPVTLTSDLYGRDVTFHGVVSGLPGGAGNVFSLLPPQNLSGNWIKIVQRLPVRVELDCNELCNFPLRVGLSMEATVDVLHEGSQMIPTPPCYSTPIYEDEELGDSDAIEKIFCDNLDPSLSKYAEESLNLPKVVIDWEIPTPISSIQLCMDESDALFNYFAKQR
jgi:membrane fusion protein (multidrug efflux system)